jgi:hypothetical protein
MTRNATFLPPRSDPHFDAQPTALSRRAISRPRRARVSASDFTKSATAVKSASWSGWRSRAPARRLPHLTLAQVFDALSYNSGHRDEVKHSIERNRIADEEIGPLVRDA